MSLNQISEKSWVTHCVKSARIRNYSGPYFPAFGLNTERYGVSLCIQSACEKIQPRITPNTDTFHAVVINLVKQAIIKLLLAYTFRKMFIIGLNLKNGYLAYSFHELLIVFWLTVGRYLFLFFFLKFAFPLHRRNAVHTLIDEIKTRIYTFSFVSETDIEESCCLFVLCVFFILFYFIFLMQGLKFLFKNFNFFSVLWTYFLKTKK